MNESVFNISVKCLPFTEELLKEELIELGVNDITIGRRVLHGSCDLKTMYRVCYTSRLALRILVPIAEFRLRKVDDLYKQAMKVEWDNLMLLDQTFAIDAHVRSDFFQHPHFASLKVKDAIADYFRQEYEKRPDVSPDNPDVLFHLHIDEEVVTISLDAGGRSLNQRGYRMGSGDAPLNEVLAAAIIKATGWKGESPFMDPMCGSGTLVTEAAMLASNTPAQIARPHFQFMKWPGFDQELWNELKAECDAKIVTPVYPIVGSDLDSSALGWATKNSRKAQVGEFVHFEKADFFELETDDAKGILVMNPPYGERLPLEEAYAFYGKLGDSFKKNWKGWNAWVFSGHLDAMKRVGLKPFKKSKWLNAKIDCVLFGYKMFDGDFKSFKQNLDKVEE